MNFNKPFVECAQIRLCISPATMARKKEAIIEGVKNYLHWNSVLERPFSEKGKQWRDAMRTLFEQVADSDPTRKYSYLPHYCKKTVYDEIGLEVPTTISFSHFRNIWRSEFRRYRIRKKDKFARYFLSYSYLLVVPCVSSFMMTS